MQKGNLLYLFLVVFAANLLVPKSTFAAVDVPTNAALATVTVQCGNQAGSGFVSKIGPNGTYVLTAGHIVTNSDGQVYMRCNVGFAIDSTFTIKSWYRANLINSIFDKRTDRDVAILKIDSHLSGPAFTPANFLVTNEFARVNDPVTALGFPGAATMLAASAGTITGFRRGSILSNVEISSGNSGGPLIDVSGNVVGIAVRILLTSTSGGQSKTTDYEMIDILDVINWMDLQGRNQHDQYLTHSSSNFDALPYLIRDESPPCLTITKSTLASTVYCIFADSFRYVFPGASTYLSWYSGFSTVSLADLTDLNKYRLIGNMTFKAGTLIKIQSDPKVYLVVDSLGTIRWIETEQKATQLFGLNWAQKIIDVPVTFFIDYTVGPSIQ